MLHWVSKVRYILGCCPRQDMLQCWSHVQCWVPRARAALSGSVAASWSAGPRRRVPSVSPGLGWAGSIVRLWSYEWSSASPASAQPRTSVWWGAQCGAGGQPVSTRGQGGEGGQCWGRTSSSQWRWSRYLAVTSGTSWAAVGGREQQQPISSQCPDTCTLQATTFKCSPPAIVRGRQWGKQFRVRTQDIC